jgi:hypothetical protein
LNANGRNQTGGLCSERNKKKLSEYSCSDSGAVLNPTTQAETGAADSLVSGLAWRQRDQIRGAVRSELWQNQRENQHRQKKSNRSAAHCTHGKMICQEGTLCAEKLLCETWREKKNDPGCALGEE